MNDKSFTIPEDGRITCQSLKDADRMSCKYISRVSVNEHEFGNVNSFRVLPSGLVDGNNGGADAMNGYTAFVVKKGATCKEKPRHDGFVCKK